MEILLPGMLAFLFLSVCALAVLLLRRNAASQGDERIARAMLEFQASISELKTALKDQTIEVSRQMNEQLRQNTDFLQETHQGYRDTISGLQHRMGELQQATHSMLDIGKDISSLQNILQSPKLRGGLGEFLLAELLKQILPEDHYSLQYTFSSGVKVDAVIILGSGMIPVDAKFPLENFRRLFESSDKGGETQARKNFVGDVKKHIDAIASKYILPEEGTFEFALMYIPAENVYYETIIKDEIQAESLSAYALRKKVIPVSPNSFYAYLQAIVRGLKGLRIERSARMILEGLGQLETDFAKCLSDFEKVGAHLANAQSAYGKVEKRFERLQSKIVSIEGYPHKGLLEENQAREKDAEEVS